MMKCSRTLRVLMLVGLCAATVSARYYRENNGEGPLEAGRWGLLAGAGVAPGFFKNRGFSQSVWPRSAITCPVTGFANNTIECNQIFNVLTTPQNVFQQSACRLPNFHKLFTNGVVHVTGQISYNVCCNAQFFLEGVYDRARGHCYTVTEQNFQASGFCSTSDCSTNCETSCSSSCSSSNSCAVTGTPLTTGQPTTFRNSNYQAYGGYLGTRWYWNRVWCDRFSFFGGFKFGMLHRKQICVNTSTPAFNDTLTIGGIVTTFNFPAATNTYVAFCKSNAVSGGIQIGFDYNINNCWSVVVGVELVATSPLKSNRNVQLTVVDPTLNGVATPVGFGRNFNQPTNRLVAPTGTLLQVPVWAGIRWEFDWCRNSCNEC